MKANQILSTARLGLVCALRNQLDGLRKLASSVHTDEARIRPLKDAAPGQN